MKIDRKASDHYFQINSILMFSSALLSANVGRPNAIGHVSTIQ